MPLHFKLRSVALEMKERGRTYNGVLTLCYVLLFLYFCNALFLTKQCSKGYHYNVEILLTGKGKVDTFLFKGIFYANFFLFFSFSLLVLSHISHLG